MMARRAPWGVCMFRVFVIMCALVLLESSTALAATGSPTCDLDWCYGTIDAPTAHPQSTWQEFAIKWPAQTDLWGWGVWDTSLWALSWTPWAIVSSGYGDWHFVVDTAPFEDAAGYEDPVIWTDCEQGAHHLGGHVCGGPQTRPQGVNPASQMEVWVDTTADATLNPVKLPAQGLSYECRGRFSQLQRQTGIVCTVAGNIPASAEITFYLLLKGQDDPQQGFPLGSRSPTYCHPFLCPQ